MNNFTLGNAIIKIDNIKFHKEKEGAYSHRDARYEISYSIDPDGTKHRVYITKMLFDEAINIEGEQGIKNIILDDVTKVAKSKLDRLKKEHEEKLRNNVINKLKQEKIEVNLDSLIVTDEL